jgi:predicted GNAT family N-acyltransferase
MPDVFDIRLISAEETRSLRRAILRPSQSPEESVYPGDDLASTLHLGAYLHDELVGVASVYREPPPETEEADANWWRLRGMAITQKLQGQGYGRALLEKCLAHVAAQGGTVMWCNARATAAGFYRSAGFRVVGEAYELPGIGAHYMMRRSLLSA